MSLAELRQRADGLGVETSYWDVEGRYHETPEHTLRRVVEVLEDDRDHKARRLPPVLIARGTTRQVEVGTHTHVCLDVGGSDVGVAVKHGRATVPTDVPMGCHRLHAAGPDGEETATLVVAPATMPRDARCAGRAGLFVPAYALWEDESPLPAFTHVAALARRLPDVGVDVLATLPLYAAFLDDPFDVSPYAPASRLHWNEVYLDDAGLPAAPVAPLGELIDWRALARRRRAQLLEAAGDLDGPGQRPVAEFVARRADVADYARFRIDRREAIDAGHPPELVRRSHELAQYLADRELAGLERPGGAALALDLPIGGHPAGFESWAYPELFASGMTIGAPPDEFFAEGQDWGFSPQLPAAGRRSGHRLWRQLIARAGEHCSILRIDHVMGVQRLWWIPEGIDPREGTYVRYPREELLAVITAEAAGTGTTVVGEDLGTVPEEVREALASWDALGMYEEQFHLGGDELAPIPARSVAGIRTHDMPAFAAAVSESPGLDRYRAMVARAVEHPVGETSDELFDAVLERLAASEAYLVVADLDDLLGEVEAHNVPGQVLETTWRRRLREPMSAMLSADVRRRLKLLSSRPGRP